MDEIQESFYDDLKYNAEPALTIVNNKHDRALNLRRAVTKTILEFGVPAHLRGYYYLREAIILKVNNQNDNIYVTKIIYPAIAKKFSVSASQVERGIRHAIEVAWQRGKFKSSENNLRFSQSAWKPTNSEFIATVAVTLELMFNEP